MACCSPPPSFCSPHRQGSRQPMRCAGGGLLPVISERETIRTGDLLRQSEQGKLSAIGNCLRNKDKNNCGVCLSKVFSAITWIRNTCLQSMVLL
ncbi:uncharacterized protein ACO6RY_08576 [Pungitius sinensis]